MEGNTRIRACVLLKSFSLASEFQSKLIRSGVAPSRDERTNTGRRSSSWRYSKVIDTERLDVFIPAARDAR